jgi:hypothetical protein
VYDLKFVFLVSFKSFDTAILFMFSRVTQSKEFGETPKLTIRQRYRRKDTGISINRRFRVNLKFVYFNSLIRRVSKKLINIVFFAPSREGPLKPKTLLFRAFVNILLQSFDYYRVSSLTGHQNALNDLAYHLLQQTR